MEVYSAHHSETVDQLLDWPWRRFERFYDSFMRRQIADGLDRRKEAMIGALWSNSNYDDDKGSRKTAIDEIEANCEEAKRAVLDRAYAARKKKEDEEFENNPFFAGMRRGVAKLEGKPIEGPVREAVDTAALDQG